MALTATLQPTPLSREFIGSWQWTPSVFAPRRSAAQLYAVSQVEQEIRAADPHSRRKYIREFAEAFQSYSALVSRSELIQEL